MNKPLKSKRHDHYLSMYKSNTKRPLRDYSVFTSTHISPFSSQKDFSSSSPCGSASASTSTSEPRSLKTLNPTCILNNHIIQNMEKNIQKKINFADNNSTNNKNTNLNQGDDDQLLGNNGSTGENLHKMTDSFLNDVQGKPSNDFYNPDLLIPNPIHYQEYLYIDENSYDQHLYKPEDSLYAAGLQNETFDSTSFELDSNVSPQSVSNENINPIFFHNTPSPSDKNSIRIVTASNRIIKLKDKKLLQAIQKSLDSNSRIEALNPNNNNDINDNSRKNNNNKSSSGFKTLNENQVITSSILSSPRKEINESLNNAILMASNLPIKRKFINPSTHQGHINNPSTNDVIIGNAFRGWHNSNNERYIAKVNDTLAFKSGFEPETNSNPNSERGSSSSNEQNINNNSDINNGNINNNLNTSNSSNKNFDDTAYMRSQKSGHADEKNQRSQHSKQILSIKREIKWKNDFQIPKLRSRRADSIANLGKSFNLEHSLVKENVGNGNFGNCDQEELSKGRDDDSEDDNLDNQSKNKDVVMEIFRESMKKNKDNFLKSKPRDKSNTPIPKITKLKVARCIPKLGDPTLRANLYEEKDIFRCAQCPKVFKQRSQWKRHVDCIHLKIAKFVCIKCGKAFKRSDHLKNHIRRIHGT